MLTRRNGGFVEFIPSPQEKREAIIRDHALALLRNLNTRIEQLEMRVGADGAGGEEFRRIATQIMDEEAENTRIFNERASASWHVESAQGRHKKELSNQDGLYFGLTLE